MPKSVMRHQFSRVPSTEIRRSSFDRSHGKKLTLNSGWLVPIFLDEVLPGDTFNLNATMFGRLATPIVPFMDNVRLSTFFFFVPYRLLWTNFKRFMGEQMNPGDSTDYLIPRLSGSTPIASESLLDYFELPVGLTPDQLDVSALPVRAYRLVWSEWFRDQNLQNYLSISMGDGPDLDSSYVALARRGKRHDYFTSCLPFAQKGEAVSLPLGISSPVTADGGATDEISVYFPNLGGGSYRDLLPVTSDSIIPDAVEDSGASRLYADLTSATAATINELRQAFQIQRMMERDARGGSRYTEIVRSHFGVISPDARLQRPEYLGGGVTPINVNPIAQTSGTPEGDNQYTPTPQGNLAAIGTVSAHGHGFTKSFTEHGLIIGLASVNADLTYQQGVNRMWSRKTKYDFYWPSLATIGEQPVYNREIYADGSAADGEVFGYNERFAEYRYKPSTICGKFRSADPQSLDVWHLAQDFANLPTLNTTFIQDNPPFKRVLAVQDEPELLLDCYFNLRCARPMPVYGVPGLIDHF